MLTYEDTIGALHTSALIREEHDEAQRIEAALDAGPRPTHGVDPLSAALWYASIGWPVFPLRPHSKVPLPGTHGFLDASTDPDAVLAQQWTYQATEEDEPERANVGLATGVKFDVVDVDGEQGHQGLIDGLGNDPAYLPTVLAIAVTPRGCHLYVPVSGRGNTAAILPGVDYRGRGGYVAAPPSSVDYTEPVLIDQPYQWLLPPQN